MGTVNLIGTYEKKSNIFIQKNGSYSISLKKYSLRKNNRIMSFVLKSCPQNPVN